MVDIPYADWITAVLTVAYLQLLTWKKWYGWPLGMLTQIFWIYFTVSKSLYGLTALSLVLTVQFAYGWYKWTRDDGATIKL